MTTRAEFVETACMLLERATSQTLVFTGECAVCANQLEEPYEICSECWWQEDPLIGEDGWSYCNGEFLADAQARGRADVWWLRSRS